MPKLSPIQQSFSNGEVTPLLHFRSDDEAHGSSVKTMQNFKPTPQGPAIRREGSDLVWWDEAGEAGECGRIFNCHFSSTESYVVVVTPTFIYVFDKGGTYAGTNLLDNPYFCLHASPVGWKDSMNARLTSVCSGIFDVPNVTKARFYQRVDVDPAHTKMKFQINYEELDGSADNAQMTMYATSDDNIADTENWTNILHVQGLRPGLNRGTIDIPGHSEFYFQISCRNGDYPEHSHGMFSVEFASVTPVLDGVIDGPLKFPSPYVDKEAIESIQVGYPPNEEALFFAGGDVTPKQLARVNGIWEFTDIPIPDKPWGASHPRVIAFHQGRLWFASSKLEIDTIWASESGDILNFVVPSTVVDSSPLEFVMDSRGEITWMLSLRELHIGTNLNENILFSQEGVITASDAKAIIQSSYGSGKLQAVYYSDGFLFVGNNKNNIYYSNYFDSKNTFISENLSFKSEHMAAHNILSLFTEVADNLNIWYVDGFGHIHVAITDPGRGIGGWCSYYTNGKYISAKTVLENNRSVHYSLVLRDVAGVSVLMLEKNNKTVYMDSTVSVSYESPTTIFEGLDHLEGQTVQVLADHVLLPQENVQNTSMHLLGDHVVVNGAITTDEPSRHVLVGLKYEAVLEILPIEIETTRSNPSNTKTKRLNKLFVKIIDSVRPIINGENPRQRTPATLMNDREPNETVDIQVTKLGHDRSVTVKIEQELPFPCVVLGVYGEMSSNRL